MNVLNAILILLATILAVFWEAAFNGIRSLLGAQIDLLPALVVLAALRTGLITMTSVAVLGGLLFDTLSANPLGVSVAPLFVVGFVIHSQRDLILRNQPFAQFVLGLAASGLAPVLTVLLLLTTGAHPLLGWGSLWQWFVMTLGGGLATPLLFRIFDLFDHILNYHGPVETSFRADRQIQRGRT